MKQVRCDLAVEAKEMLTELEGDSYVIPGVEFKEEEVSGYIRMAWLPSAALEGGARCVAVGGTKSELVPTKPSRI